MEAGNIKIVFMGTPDFAVGPLKALKEAGISICGVVTAPDKPAGRGKKLRAPAVKEYAEANLNCEIFQPEKLRNEDFVEALKKLEADMFIVVAFRMLPEVVWSIPHKGTINLHASLLPQYRGAAPINWCIINGESETGVTTFLIDKEIDTGRILLNEKVAITENESAGTLHDKLMSTGSDLIVKTVLEHMNGNIQALDQEDCTSENTALKSAPKIFKDDCKIDWSESGMSIYNKIRGLSPFPTAFTAFRKEKDETIGIKLYESSFILKQHSHTIGSLHTDYKTFLHVAVADGFIELKTLQMAGKKRMSINDFLRGYNGELKFAE